MALGSHRVLERRDYAAFNASPKAPAQSDNNARRNFLLPALLAGNDEPRVLEHAQVLHDPEARHLQLGLELGERAAVTLEETVEQMPPRRVGECLEDAVAVVHAQDDR